MKSKFQKSIKNRIYQVDWQNTRPVGIISSSDAYFVNLSNKILSIFNEKSVAEIFSIQSQRNIAINVAAYFEDVISGFGLWQAFTSIHKTMYGKYLPFLDLNNEVYVPDEINSEDVQFLIWAELQRYDIDNEVHRFLNPENPMIFLLANVIYDLLDQEYETAPANDAIYKYIHQTKLTDDIITTRELLGWLHYDSYLSMSYPRLKLKSEIEELRSNKNNEFYRENFGTLSYAMEKIGIFSRNCSPLAIKAKDWLAQIFDGTPKAKMIEAIDFKQIDNYNIVDFDNEYLTIVNAENEKLIVSLDSLGKQPEIKGNNSIMCSLFYFNDFWHVNGFASFSKLDKELDNDNTKSKIKENNKLTYDYIIKKIKKPISYYADSKDLIKVLTAIFPDSDNNRIFPDKFKSYSNFILFVHPEIGLSFYPILASHVCDPKNPYYDKDVVEHEGLSVLTGLYEIPKELIEYLIDNNLLKNIALKSLHGETYGKKQLQDNIRFVVRFFQPRLYS